MTRTKKKNSWDTALCLKHPTALSFTENNYSGQYMLIVKASGTMQKNYREGGKTTHTSSNCTKKASKVRLEFIDSKPGKSESAQKLLRSHVVFIWPKIKKKKTKQTCA